MNINGKHEALAQTARGGLLLAALLATVLSVATSSRAQSNSAPAPISGARSAGAPAATAQAPAPTAEPAALVAKETAAPTDKSAAKGPHEGISVHGYWIIDVRNTDGRVTAHREFENSLIGGDVISNVLNGIYTALGWSVTLTGGAGVQSNSPCGSVSCFLFEATTGANKVIAGGDGGDCGATTNCLTVLTRSPALGVLVPHSNPMVTLQGSFPAQSTGYVGNVSTVFLGCINATVISTTTPAGLSTVAPSDCTAGNIPSTGVDTFRQIFTNTQVNPPIPVVNGQTVSATVQISFSSN
jgi:hypothetical protein